MADPTTVRVIIPAARTVKINSLPLMATGGGGSGTVTSVAVSGANGIGVSGSPITTSGTIALSLGAITPTTVNGDTITTGTGTLTLGANTLTASHNITLDTDGTGTRTLNIAAGGTLGSNAFNSTAFLTANQTITLSGDATGSGSTAITVTNVNLPDGVTQAGSILATNIVAPATPASGKSKFYFDLTSKNIASKNDAGTVNHGIQTRIATASNWIRSVADDGSTTISQPSYTDISGTVPAVTSIATTSPISGGTITTTGTVSLLTNVDFSFTHSETITIAPAHDTFGDGLILTDTTAAAAGNQQYSPGVHFTGQGWKTTATAASQPVDFRTYLVPVQGAANPSGYLTTESAINGGSFGNQWNIFSSGGASLGSTTDPGAGQINAANGFKVGGSQIAFSNIAGTWTLAQGDTSTSVANKVLLSGASAAPQWSTPTYPNVAGAAGKVVCSDASNLVMSSPTFPTTSASGTNKVIKADGTNWVASTETYAAPGTSGNLMTSDGTNWTSATPVKQSRSITVENPTATENIPICFITAGGTITKVIGVLVGSSTPSVTYNIGYGTDVTSLTNVTTSPAALTSTTTGTTATLNNVTVPANGWVVFKTTAQSGTVNQITVTVEF